MKKLEPCECNSEGCFFNTPDKHYRADNVHAWAAFKAEKLQNALSNLESGNAVLEGRAKAFFRIFINELLELSEYEKA